MTTPDDPASALRAEADALRAELVAARRRATVLEDTLNAIFHDVRGPLNTILGWSSLLRQSAPPAMTRGLETIDRNARLQTWMLDEAHELYHLAGGATAENLVDTDLAALVEEVAAVVRAGLNCEVQVSTDGARPTVRVDVTLVRQVLRFLLTFLGRVSGAQVRVASGVRDDLAWVTLTEPKRGHLPFDGLEAYARGDTFEGVFSRAAGVVLLAAFNVARAHGGAVRPAEQGLELTFPLVLSSSRETTVPTEASVKRLDDAATSLAGLSILVVDDDPHAREIVAVILSGQGAKVRSAESAAAALRAFRAQRPDLLVSDIGMPEQDGYDLIRQIRALRPEEGSGVPAIALSALTRADDRNRSQRAGFQLHVSKPVSATEVIEAVRSLLRTPPTTP